MVPADQGHGRQYHPRVHPLGNGLLRGVLRVNQGQSRSALLIHGVWIDDYVQNSHMDAFNAEYLTRFKEDIRTVIDVIHGQRLIELGHLSVRQLHEGRFAVGTRVPAGRRVGSAHGCLHRPRRSRAQRVRGRVP